MSELFAPILLFGIAILWFSLPLVPTIVEVRKRSGARPLVVDRANEGEIRHFANAFKALLESNFQQPTLRQCIDQRIDLQGKFSDGTPYRVIGPSADSFLTATRSSRSIPELLVFSGAMVIPAGLQFVYGIYAAEDIDCGNETLIRSLHGARNVRLGARTVVLRWIHVDNELVAEAGCVLYGRVSAEQSMRIGAGVEFERLHAPRIVFGKAEIAAPVTVAANTPLRLAQLNATRMAGNCYAIEADLDVPPDTLIRGDFVVRGVVRVGRGSRVEGSIKSNRDMWIEDGAVIEGSVISGKDLDMGSACRIRGPAVATGEMRIHTGCQIGGETYPTTATAPHILVDPGVLVFGTVWARENGRVGGEIAR